MEQLAKKPKIDPARYIPHTDTSPNYAVAEFRIEVPKHVKEPKAVLVLIPGSNGDGRDLVDEQHWVSFAERHQLALCGCKYLDYYPSMEEDYCKVSLGSGQALLDALTKAGYKDLPLLLWGFSAGGQFAYEFTCWHPEKVIAFVLNKGGVYFTALAKKDARMVPGLLFLGKRDTWWRQDIIRGLYALNTAFGSNWELVEEDVAHALGDSERRSIAFFSHMLNRGPRV